MNRVMPIVWGCLILFCSEFVPAAGLRALPEGRLPEDHRLGELRHTGTARPFEPSADAATWQARRERLQDYQSQARFAVADSYDRATRQKISEVQR